MKVPEFLFVIINPVMKFFLRSPLHFLWSKSLMLITFTGRKSGRQFTTPVRYVQYDDAVRCFTGRETQWWRNLRGGAEVVLRIRGEDARYSARAIDDDAEEIRRWLVDYLGRYPQDAVYHEIRLNKDRSLVAEDIEAALERAVVVEAKRVSEI